MSEKSIDDITQHFVNELDLSDPTADTTTTAINNLKKLVETQKLLEPDPIPDPEPSGVKGFVTRYGSELIKVGGTLAAIATIGIIEAKGDVIFRSKATKYL